MRLHYVLLGIIVILLAIPSVSADPSLSSPRVTPSSGYEDAVFTFTVHYVCEVEPASMQVILDTVAHDMSAVDQTDLNTTDGKDYYFESRLPEGTTIYYFKAVINQTTTIQTTAATVLVKGITVQTVKPALSSPRITPTTGESGTLFTFTVHYAGEEQLASMQVMLGTEAHDMLEVDQTDLNTTDGKDYYFENQLPEGTTIYYFKAITDQDTIVTTTATTINVRGPEGWEISHLDVVFAVLIFLIPTVWALILFKKFSKDVIELLEEFKKNRD